MEEKEFQKKLEGILHKRRNCIALTPEEEKLVDEAVNKLLDGKQTVRKSLQVKTGDEIRKADIAERKQLKVSTDVSAAPIREENRSDKKEEARPTEDTSGDIQGEYADEEYADTDEIPYEPHTEEDRLADILEGKKHYKNSIRVKALVAKSLSNGSKLVGQVIKVYNPDQYGRYAIMVKWSNGQFESLNAANVELLKAEKPEEEKKPFPFDKPAEKPAENSKPEEKAPEVKEGEEETRKEVNFTSEAPAEFIEEVVKTLTETTDLSKDEIVEMAKAAWAEIYEANKTSEETPAEKPAQE